MPISDFTAAGQGFLHAPRDPKPNEGRTGDLFINYISLVIFRKTSTNKWERTNTLRGGRGLTGETGAYVVSANINNQSRLIIGLSNSQTIDAGFIDTSGDIISTSITPTNAIVGDTLEDHLSRILYPENFNASVGSGADDTVALSAWAAACNASGATAALDINKTYNISSGTTITLRVPFRGNGSEIVAPNNGQTTPIVMIDSVSSDIESVSLATINTWTGLYRGSTKIPQITGRGWVYAFSSSNGVWLTRSSGGGAPIGASFSVVTDAGAISPALPMSLPAGAFTAVTASRRRIRHAITIDGLKVRYSSGSGTSSVAVRISRPNTKLQNCHIQNDTATEVFQGFAIDNTGGVTFERCSVDGLRVNSTNYAWNSNYSHDINLIDCHERFCRRGFDGNAVVSNVKISGGVFPDGVGGHSIFGLYVDRAWLGTGNTANPRCIMASGADVVARDCTFVISQSGGSAMHVREDVPEMRGAFGMIGGKVIIDDTAGAMTSSPINLVKVWPSSNYDTVRAIHLPDRIFVKPDSVEQLGATSAPYIYPLSVGTNASNAQFPQDIIASGIIDVDPGNITLAAGDLLTGLPRLQINLQKAFNQEGSGYIVRIRNMPVLTIYAPSAASATQAAGRYDIFIEGLRESISGLNLTGSAYRTIKLRNSNTSIVPTIGAPIGPVGDETITFEELGINVQLFTTVGANTWTKAPGSIRVHARLLGGGGGGGSGAKINAGTASSGGGAGGGGLDVEGWFDASALGATEPVTVGSGGTGGAAQTTANTVGNNGTAGSASTFSSGTNLLTAWGGGYGSGGQNNASSAGGGSAGSRGPGGNAAASTAGAAGSTGGVIGGSGANGSSATTRFGGASGAGTAAGAVGNTGGTAHGGSGGGGSGAGVSAANATFAGGQVLKVNEAFAPAGGTVNGGAGVAGVIQGPFGTGCGGTGGGSHTTGDGGAGGAGGPGAGGGGGGASQTGNSGPGGIGGNGFVRVTSYL